MPGMNGIEMIRQGQASYPDTAYVVLSGYGDYEYTSQAMELGVRHYILKPCDDAKIMLLGRAQPGAGGRALVEELGGSQRQVMLLDFRLRSGFDALERYVVGNMLSDLLPDGASDDRRGRQGRPGPGRRGG